MNFRLFCVAIALVCVGCAAETPTKPSTPLPEKGAPARLELNAVVATGANGGTATVTARVIDAFANVIVGMPVNFSASSGTFSETDPITSDKGIATTTLTADPGTVTITAKTGGVQSQTTVSVQPRSQGPTPTPNPPPAPPPPPPAPGAFSLSASCSGRTFGQPTTCLASVLNATGAATIAWDFGDGGQGTSTVVAGGSTGVATHQYGAIGPYHVTAIGRDAVGHSASAATDITIDPLPPATLTAALAASPATVTAFSATTLTVTATAANGAVAATSYTIDCGDGSAAVTSASKTRSCTYTTPGTKTATATATNGVQTSASATTTVTVTAAPAPTITVDCSIGTSTTTGPAAVSACNVAATLGTTPVDPATINISSWTWGDGQTGTPGLGQVSQSHQYTLPSGTTGYTVIVTATVPNGGAAGTGTGHAIVH